MRALFDKARQALWMGLVAVTASNAAAPLKAKHEALLTALRKLRAVQGRAVASGEITRLLVVNSTPRQVARSAGLSF